MVIQTLIIINNILLLLKKCTFSNTYIFLSHTINIHHKKRLPISNFLK